MTAQYPDVPVSPGVPAVKRYPAYVGNVVAGINGVSAVITPLVSSVAPISGVASSYLTTTLGRLDQAKAGIDALQRISSQSAIFSINGALSSATAANSVVASIDPGLGLQIGAAIKTINALKSAIQSMRAVQKKAAAMKVVRNIWGIYDSEGNKVINPDTVSFVGYRNDHRISDFPIEQGGFTSYNKVRLPNTVAIRIVKGGSQADRINFLAELVAFREDTKLYTILTPEAKMTNMNLVTNSFDRSLDSGAAMIVLDLVFQEIRQAGPATYSNTVAPAGALPVNNGPTQAGATTATGSGIQ